MVGEKIELLDSGSKTQVRPWLITTVRLMPAHRLAQVDFAGCHRRR
jgi:hypothetical protein